MKRIVAIIILTSATSIAAHAVRPTTPPRVRVSAPHDHSPKLHTKAAVAHK